MGDRGIEIAPRDIDAAALKFILDTMDIFENEAQLVIYERSPSLCIAKGLIARSDRHNQN